MWLKNFNIQNFFKRNGSTARTLAKSIRMCRMSASTAAAFNDKSESTVDQADVQHHTNLMKDWWDPRGPMKALHTYNTIRVPFVRDGLVDCPPEDRTPNPLKGKTILDVGCGGGILSEPLARLGAKVTGIDASKDLIGLATQHSLLDPKLQDNKPTYTCTLVEDYAKENENVYDGVVASEIIEHVTNPELFLRSCIRTLKPGGRLFITTPNRTKLAEFAVIHLAENILSMIPKGTHQIEKFMTPPEVTFLLERNDCHVELLQGIFYNVLTNRWSWCSYQSLAYAIQAVKLNKEDEVK